MPKYQHPSAAAHLIQELPLQPAWHLAESNESRASSEQSPLKTSEQERHRVSLREQGSSLWLLLKWICFFITDIAYIKYMVY